MACIKTIDMYEQVINCEEIDELKEIINKYSPYYCKCQYKNVGFISYKHVGKTTCLYDIF